LSALLCADTLGYLEVYVSCGLRSSSSPGIIIIIIIIIILLGPLLTQ
jgi:hypothetical protein